MSHIPIILASGSPARLELLKKVGISPTVIISDVDETELKGELPAKVAERLAIAKAERVAEGHSRAIIIGADSVCCVGRRILPKATTDDMVRSCMKLLSGRRHNIYTGVCVIKKSEGNILRRIRTVKTVVQFKNLTDMEIEKYVSSGEGLGKAGGYAVQGCVQSYVSFIGGSFSNIIGLPLFETCNMLVSLGYNN